MKEKIIAAIKAKFPAVNLSKARLDAFAAKIEAKTTDENEIDAKVDELNEWVSFADIAKQDDAQRNITTQLKQLQQQQQPPKKKEGEKTDPPANGGDENDPNNKIVELLTQLTQKVSNLEKEKLQTTVQSKATELLKDVPASYWNKRQLPEDAEKLQEFVDEVTTDWDAFQKDLTDQGLGTISGKPGGGTGSGGATKEASKEEVDAVLNNIM